jgi:hypothetical protein
MVELTQFMFLVDVNHRVPCDWTWPGCNTLSLWRQWWIGDDVQQIAPLRFLAPIDVEFLNRVPLMEDERSGRVGPRASGGRFWREAKKVLSELWGLMHIIEDLVREEGTLKK